jgi:hypothetical protein
MRVASSMCVASSVRSQPICQLDVCKPKNNTDNTHWSMTCTPNCPPVDARGHNGQRCLHLTLATTILDQISGPVFPVAWKALPVPIPDILL